jgi:hypothetical protein
VEILVCAYSTCKKRPHSNTGSNLLCFLIRFFSILYYFVVVFFYYYYWKDFSTILVMEFSSWIADRAVLYFIGFPAASRWRIALFPSAGAVAWVRPGCQSTGTLPTFIDFLLLLE